MVCMQSPESRIVGTLNRGSAIEASLPCHIVQKHNLGILRMEEQWPRSCIHAAEAHTSTGRSGCCRRSRARPCSHCCSCRRLSWRWRGSRGLCGRWSWTGRWGRCCWRWGGRWGGWRVGSSWRGRGRGRGCWCGCSGGWCGGGCRGGGRGGRCWGGCGGGWRRRWRNRGGRGGCGGGRGRVAGCRGHDGGSCACSSSCARACYSACMPTHNLLYSLSTKPQCPSSHLQGLYGAPQTV